MTVMVSSFSLFMATKLFQYKYLNDFTMNPGYLLVYNSIFWGFQAIYISELVGSSVKCH